MDLIGESLAFVLILCFGMVAVGIHAHSLYSQNIPSSRKMDETSNILESLTVLNLGGRYFFYRGFAAYLFITESLFLLLASSTVILEMAVSAVGRSDLAGALSQSVEFNPLIPIIASTVVIAASQVRPLSDFEMAVRKLAHSIAGVPGTAYEIKEKVNNKLGEILDERVARTINDDENATTFQQHEDMAAVASAKVIADLVVKNLKNTELDQYEIHQFSISVAKIYCLMAWTYGGLGNRIWTGSRTEQIKLMFSSINDSYTVFKRQVDLISSGQAFFVSSDSSEATIKDGDESIKAADNPTDNNQKRKNTKNIELRELVALCNRLLDELLIVLALMFVNKPEATLKPDTPLHKLRYGSLISNPRSMFNAFIIGLSKGFMLALVLLICYTSIIKDGVVKNGWGVLPGAVSTDELGPLFTTNEISLTLSKNFLHEITDVRPGIHVSIQQQLKERILTIAVATAKSVRDNTWEVLNYIAIFGVSTAVALALRRTRLKIRRWESGSEAWRPPPITTYLSFSIYAYIFSVCAFLLVNFSRLFLVPSIAEPFAVFSATNLVVLYENLPRILLLPLVSVAFVWFACTYLDRLCIPESSKSDLVDNESGLESDVEGLVENVSDSGTIIKSKPATMEVGPAPDVKLCIFLGVAIALYNCILQASLGNFETAWNVVDSLIMPFLCFSAFAYQYCKVWHNFPIKEIDGYPEVLSEPVRRTGSSNEKTNPGLAQVKSKAQVERTAEPLS